jgi:hypothetical protein
MTYSGRRGIETDVLVERIAETMDESDCAETGVLLRIPGFAASHSVPKD